MTRFDLVIMGSGSTAFAAALRAAELGKTALMTESRTLGGTCVNRGCLPSKNLIEAARLYWEAQHPRFPGLEPAQMTLDFSRLIAGKDDVIAHYRERKYEAAVADRARITVLDGHAELLDPHRVRVGDREVEGDQILIATGARPARPDIPGLDQTEFLTSDLLTWGEDQELRELPSSLVVIGGGYIALELGQMFRRFGSQVTVLERSDRVLPAYEPEISGAVEDALTGDGVDIRTSARVQAVRRHGQRVIVEIEQGGHSETIQAEHLLVATGRQPNTDGIGLARAGVRLDDHGFVLVDDELRTSVPHIWAAGDIIGGHQGSQMATPVGAHDGGIAAENALANKRRKVDHSVVPRAIFTDPQVAVVGLTDAQAQEKGIDCVCRTVPMSLIPRAGAVRDERGVVKMVAERESGRVVGVSIAGRDAGEIIHEAAMGLRFGATVRDFVDMIHVYPTMAEALKIVALSFFKDVSKMSCCAE